MIATLKQVIDDYNVFKPYFEKYGDMPEIGTDLDMSNIRVSVSKMTSVGGHADFQWHYNHKKDELWIDNLTLTISNSLDFPEYQYYDTLLHEMAHVFEYVNNPDAIRQYYVNGRKYDFHGKYFEDITGKISNDTGYRITKYMDMLELKDMKSTMKGYVVVMYGKYDDKLYMVVTPNGLKKFKGFSSRYYPYCEVYSTDTGTLTYPFVTKVHATPDLLRKGKGVFRVNDNVDFSEWKRQWLNTYKKIDELDWE